MSLKRYTEEGQDRRKKQLEEMRTRLQEVKNIEGLREDPAWKSMKKIIEGFIQSEKHATDRGVVACAAGGNWDQTRNGIEPVSDARLVSDIRVSYERQMGFQLVIDLVDKNQAQIQHLEEAIQTIESTFKEAKAQLA